MPYYPPTGSASATTTGSNVGTGEGLVFYSVTGSDLAFRSLLAGTNIQITTTTNIITISGPAGSGEANTASNVGTGAGQVYKSKTGVNLDLRNIAVGPNINVTTGTNDITIGLTTSVSNLADVNFTNTGSAPATPSSGQTMFMTAGGLSTINASGNKEQYFPGAFAVLTGSTVSASVTHADTGLVSQALQAGYYMWQVFGSYQSNTTTCGFGARFIEGTATVTENMGSWLIRQAADGTAQHFQYSQLSSAVNVASASVVAAATKYQFHGFGWMRISVAGTVKLQFRSEVASPSQVTLSTGTAFSIVRVG